MTDATRIAASSATTKKIAHSTLQLIFAATPQIVVWCITRKSGALASASQRASWKGHSESRYAHKACSMNLMQLNLPPSTYTQTKITRCADALGAIKIIVSRDCG